MTTQQKGNGQQTVTTEQARSLLDQVLDEPVKRFRAIGDALESRIARLEEVLPDSMKGQGPRLARRAMMTLARRPELKDCPAPEFIRVVLEAAELGLAIDGRLAYVVKYKSAWQLQIDYKGLIAVAKRSGQITDAYADVVHEADEFDAYREDDRSKLYHKALIPGDRGPVIAAYAVIILPHGLWRFELMDRADLDRIQGLAPAKNGPWSSHTNEMRKKTVIRRGLKTYCDDPAVQAALDTMDRDDDLAREESPLPAAPPLGRVSLRAKGVQITSEVTEELPVPVVAEPPAREPGDEPQEG